MLNIPDIGEGEDAVFKVHGEVQPLSISCIGRRLPT